MAERPRGGSIDTQATFFPFAIPSFGSRSWTSTTGPDATGVRSSGIVVRVFSSHARLLLSCMGGRTEFYCIYFLHTEHTNTYRPSINNNQWTYVMKVRALF